MKIIAALSLTLFFFISNLLFSQQMQPLKVDSLVVSSVKQDVWIPFMESYRDLDFEKLKSIHTADITHVGIHLNQIESGESYLNKLGAFFKQIKDLGYQMNITFSIISSATSEHQVYQTGYYNIGFKKNDQSPYQSTGYSFFSVLISKEEGTWKIAFDSDKPVMITQEEFKKAGTYTLE